MADRQVLARLRITPCGLFEQITHTISLEQIGSGYFVAGVERNRLTRKQSRRRVAVNERAAEEQLAALKQATLPAFPVSPEVCDGEYVELTVEGEYSTLTLGWWTIAPMGAEALAEFANWLRKLGLPDEEDDDDGGLLEVPS